jgi:hypothetical protein
LSDHYSDNLCNESIRSILYIVCKSKSPLSSTQIFNLLQDNSTYIYKIIRKLCHLPTRPSVKCLETILKEKIDKLALNAKKEFELADGEYRKAKDDYRHDRIRKQDLKTKEEKANKTKDYYFKRLARNYRYIPNFRSILVYLYNEFHLKRTDSRRIRNIISNPVIIKLAPFLEYWEEFEEQGFDVLGLLKEISTELSHQLHITAENDTYLLNRATERYFVQLENYFYYRLDSTLFASYIEKVGIEKYHQILTTRNEYRKHIISFQKTLIGERTKMINFLDKECNTFGFTEELHRVIDAGSSNKNNTVTCIPIDRLAQKYQMSSSEAINGIASPILNINPDEPNYYDYKGNKYLITDPCLILASTAEELKSVLIENNNNKTITKFSEASSFLAKKDIPTSCHSEIIRKLGFDMIQEKEGGRFNLHNPSIVRRSLYSFKNFFDSVEEFPMIFLRDMES